MIVARGQRRSLDEMPRAGYEILEKIPFSDAYENERKITTRPKENGNINYINSNSKKIKINKEAANDMAGIFHISINFPRHRQRNKRPAECSNCNRRFISFKSAAIAGKCG